MRQIGTLPEASKAQLLADYLLTLRIQTRLEQQPAGWAVWVCDEDQVERARQELAQFLLTPTESRYTRAPGVARSLRVREDQQDEEYRQKQLAVRESLTAPAPKPRRLTLLLVFLSVLISFLTSYGKDPSLLRLFTITDLPTPNAPFPSLARELASGEVWRLVTPIFVHLDPFHLLFNMVWLVLLGGAIEQKRGPWRFLGLVLLLAVLTNLAQFYLGHVKMEEGIPILTGQPSPRFGGMSGVIYGLFGYVWMKSHFEPELELEISTANILILILWFFFCLGLENVANMAHAAGLVLGTLAGLVPTLPRTER